MRACPRPQRPSAEHNEPISSRPAQKQPQLRGVRACSRPQRPSAEHNAPIHSRAAQEQPQLRGVRACSRLRDPQQSITRPNTAGPRKNNRNSVACELARAPETLSPAQRAQTQQARAKTTATPWRSSLLAPQRPSAQHNAPIQRRPAQARTPRRTSQLSSLSPQPSSLFPQPSALKSLPPYSTNFNSPQ